MLNQDKMPLLENIARYIKNNSLRFHMPGHQGKPVAGLKELLGNKIFLADLTELPCTDDLHAPQGAICEAENLTAELYGAKASIFLVNGVTQGIIALMLLDKGQKVIMPRNAHKSLYHGLILSGAEPLYIKSEYLPEWGIFKNVSFDHYCNVVANNLDAKQVWLTSPTYYGHTENISLFKKYLPDDAKIFVDEAHGAHLRFIGIKDALAQGAHASVQGWHKSVGSLTQSAVIHLADHDLAMRVRENIALTETTSPSYLLMASLDAARHNLAHNGEKIFKELKEEAEDFCLKIKEIPHIKVMPTDDFTKIALKIEGLSGYELYDCLVSEGIYPELAAAKFVLLQIGLNFNNKIKQKIIKSFKRLQYKYAHYKEIIVSEPMLPRMVIRPREAYFAEKTTLAFEKSAGKMCGEFIVPYPPGIPVLVPGEVIAREHIDYLTELKIWGAHFQGTHDPMLKTIFVLKE